MANQTPSCFYQHWQLSSALSTVLSPAAREENKNNTVFIIVLTVLPRTLCNLRKIGLEGTSAGHHLVQLPAQNKISPA